MRGYIGLQLQSVTPILRTGLASRMPRVRWAGGSPADKAGVKSGDVILAVNGQSIADARELSREIAALKPGDKASLSVWRDRVRSAFCCHSSRTFCLRLRLSIF
jgi:serine protease Do